MDGGPSNKKEGSHARSTYGRGHALVDFLVNLRFMYAIAHGHRIASEQIAVLESRGRDDPTPRQSVD
ncbi:unnamed protein product [Urochloa humidicola]